MLSCDNTSVPFRSHSSTFSKLFRICVPESPWDSAPSGMAQDTATVTFLKWKGNEEMRSPRATWSFLPRKIVLSEYVENAIIQQITILWKPLSIHARLGECGVRMKLT